MSTSRNNFCNIPEVIIAIMLPFLENEEMLIIIHILCKIRRITRLILPSNTLCYNECKRIDLIRANKIIGLQNLKVDAYLPLNIEDSRLLCSLSYLTGLHLYSIYCITGDILTCISSLTQLTSLTLHNYIFTSSLMEEEISKLTRLTHISLKHAGDSLVLSKPF